MLALPTASSGERRTHSSKLRREQHAHRWPSRWGEQCWLYQQWALESWELIPQNERELRRSEGSGMLIGDPLGEGSNASSTDSELWRAENSFLRMRGNFRRSEGSGMLIGDPLCEGSNASSTDNELWRAENSFLRMRGNSDAQKGAACSQVTLYVRGAMLALPTTSSGERRTHSSEWEGTHLILFYFFVLAGRKFPPNLGQVEFTVVTGELERNKRACLSLTRASLSP